MFFEVLGEKSDSHVFVLVLVFVCLASQTCIQPVIDFYSVNSAEFLSDGVRRSRLLRICMTPKRLT